MSSTYSDRDIFCTFSGHAVMYCFRWYCSVVLSKNELDVTPNGMRVKCSVITSRFGLVASSTHKNLRVFLSQQPRSARRPSRYQRPVLPCVFEVEGGCPLFADRTLGLRAGNHSAMGHLL